MPDRTVPPFCRTPDKMKYGSRREAMKQAKYLRQNIPTYTSALEPYQCAAGHWHLTTVKA